MVKLAVQLMLHVISKRSVMACRLLKRVYHLCLVCLWCLCAPCYCLSLRNSCCCSIPFALRWLTVVRYILRKYYQQVQWLSFQSVWFLYFAASSDRVERWGQRCTLCSSQTDNLQFAVSKDGDLLPLRVKIFLPDHSGRNVLFTLFVSFPLIPNVSLFVSALISSGPRGTELAQQLPSPLKSLKRKTH